MFDYYRSIYPDFDRIEARDRVNGILQSLTTMRENRSAFLVGEDLQLRAVSVALLSKNNAIPSLWQVEKLLAEAFPNHPLLSDRRKLSKTYNDMAYGKAQRETAEAAQHANSDLTEELKCLTCAKANASPKLTCLLVEAILRVFPGANSSSEDARTHAFGEALTVLEAMKRFSLDGLDVPRLAAIGAAWSIDKRQPTKKRVESLLTKVYGTSKTKGRFGYVVLAVEQYGGDSEPGGSACD